jgi:hypothetical protein
MGYRLKLPPVTRVCGKKRHYIRPAADGHRAALEREEELNGATKPGTIGTYWCEQCKAYHVGHRRFSRHGG